MAKLDTVKSYIDPYTQPTYNALYRDNWSPEVLEAASGIQDITDRDLKVANAVSKCHNDIYKFMYVGAAVFMGLIGLTILVLATVADGGPQWRWDFPYSKTVYSMSIFAALLAITGWFMTAVLQSVRSQSRLIREVARIEASRKS